MMNSLFFTFAFCLGLTILLETIFALFVGVRGRKNILLVMLVQVVTNPCCVLAMMWCHAHLNWPLYAYALPIESCVVVVEWLFYRKYLTGIQRKFSFALAANYFSYSFGFILSGFGFYF